MCSYNENTWRPSLFISHFVAKYLYDANTKKSTTAGNESACSKSVNLIIIWRTDLIFFWIMMHELVSFFPFECLRHFLTSHTSLIIEGDTFIKLWAIIWLIFLIKIYFRLAPYLLHMEISLDNHNFLSLFFWLLSPRCGH